MNHPEVFDTAAIEKFSGVAALRYLPTTESTSDSAKAWIRTETVPVPALVLTADQTQGRGQRDRSWLSVPGNLTATWIFSGPAETAERTRWAGRISIVSALAVYDTIVPELGDCSHLLKVKWPNDIHFANQKISGILIETQPGVNCSYGVVGIGINVNRPTSATDPGFADVASSATSIRQHSGREIDLTELVIALSRNLNRRMESLTNENMGWVSEYNSRLMNINRIVTTDSSGPEVTGWCRGINSSGAMQIETPAGIQLVTSGSLAPRATSGADQTDGSSALE